MKLGKTYDIYNKGSWTFNAHLCEIVEHHDGLIQFGFELPSGESLVIDVRDSETLTPWDPSRIRYKGYMYITK